MKSLKDKERIINAYSWEIIYKTTRDNSNIFLEKDLKQAVLEFEDYMLNTASEDVDKEPLEDLRMFKRIFGKWEK